MSTYTRLETVREVYVVWGRSVKQTAVCFGGIGREGRVGFVFVCVCVILLNRNLNKKQGQRRK